MQASPKPIILFIDEAHTLVGAGGAAGTGDAANLLKPALARGTLRTIAATTWAEYKKHIEKDPALTRRFQVVQVDEPSEEKAILMMRGMASTLEKHHRVQILDEALEAAVTPVASLHPGAAAARQVGEPARHRLRPRRDQPARRAARGRRLPPPHRGARDGARDHRPRDGGRHRDRQPARRTPTRSSPRERERLGVLEERWKSEKELVDQMLDAPRQAPRRRRRRRCAGSEQGARRTRLRQARCCEPAETRRAADAAQGRCRRSSPRCRARTPLILPSVDQQAVGAVVADWTGIPVGRMVKDEIADGAQPRRHPRASASSARTTP